MVGRGRKRVVDARKLCVFRHSARATCPIFQFHCQPIRLRQLTTFRFCSSIEMEVSSSSPIDSTVPVPVTGIGWKHIQFLFPFLAVGMMLLFPLVAMVVDLLTVAEMPQKPWGSSTTCTTLPVRLYLYDSTCTSLTVHLVMIYDGVRAVVCNFVLEGPRRP